MKSIEDHIEYDKKIADDPQANPAARRIFWLLLDVVALNISIPPAKPRNNITAPPITKL